MKKSILVLFLVTLLLPTSKFTIANATIIQEKTGGAVYNCTISKIPSNMKELLDCNNIYITDVTIDTISIFRCKSSTTMGLYDGTTRNIYVSARYGNTTQVSHVLSHELGHALDAFTKEDEKMNDEPNKIFYTAGWVGKYSNTSEFKELKELYYSAILPYSQELYFNDINEFFAESYAIYVENPNLRSKFPHLYSYYDRVTRSISRELQK